MDPRYLPTNEKVEPSQTHARTAEAALP
jgi:hypothetical protein